MADSQTKPTSEYHGEQDREAFWETARLEREPAKQRWYLPSLLLLIVLSIPWYREAGSMGTLVLGMPVWIWTSLACTAGVSLLTAVAALRFWRDRD